MADTTERIYKDIIWTDPDTGLEYCGELHCNLGDDGLIVDFWPVGPQADSSPVGAEGVDLADSVMATCGLDFEDLAALCHTGKQRIGS